MWYAHALIEYAWQLVNSPDADPDEVRQAADHVARIEPYRMKTGTRRQAGRWGTLVLAQVAFANGNAALARSHLQEASSLPIEPNAPDDLDELMDAAGKRFGK